MTNKYRVVLILENEEILLKETFDNRKEAETFMNQEIAYEDFEDMVEDSFVVREEENGY